MIDIARDFTRFPAGRYRTDGHYSGERFREEYLVPALKEHGRITVLLDGTIGYGSSFLEEAFGGLTRLPDFDGRHLTAAIDLQSRDPSLIEEIGEYLNATRH